MNTLLYSIGIGLYGLAVAAAALVDTKARLWTRGRRHWRRSLAAALDGNTRPVVWIHAASLGEFEQGRPVIEALRESRADVFVLLTFFSPSGYEIRKNYPLADHVAYLPLDTRRNARRFVATARPAAAVFVKYEFWFNTLEALRRHGTPTWLVSGIFRPGQHFFRPWGGWFRRRLRCFDHLFVQDAPSAALLASIGLAPKTTVCGDTRFDRVRRLAAEAPSNDIVARFANGQPLLVAGSTWPPDEDLIAQHANSGNRRGIKYVIAPHEIGERHLAQLQAKLPANTTRYSAAADDPDLPARDALIIDNIGLLASIYRHAAFAYIGGGFGKGIHNTLEPAAYGLGVIFGPRHAKFKEARDMAALGTAFPISNYDDFAQAADALAQNSELRDNIKAKQRQYMESMSGATAKAMESISRALAR